MDAGIERTLISADGDDIAEENKGYEYYKDTWASETERNGGKDEDDVNKQGSGLEDSKD